MPIYTYKCSENHVFDRFLSLNDYKEPQICDCGCKSQKIILPTMLNCDIAPWDSYISPASGKLITSYKERAQDQKATGTVDYDEGVKRDNILRQKKTDDDLDKMVDETVEREFDAMPVKQKERLENELKYSTLEYTRD